MVDKAVLKFEVSVDNPQFMDVLYPTDNLLENFACFFFSHSLPINDIVK